MTPEELDTHADTIRDSIYADDRQTQLQIGHGLASLRAMTQEIERLQVAFDGIVKLHDVNLRELEQLKCELAEKECTCGSGAHPRRCLRHPQGFDLHVAQLNYEVAQDTIQELEKELEQAKRELAEKSEQVDSLISEVTSMKCAHVHPSIRWASKQMWNYVMGRDVSAATVAEVTHAIEAKKAELTRLREALTQITYDGPIWRAVRIAKEALNPSPSKPEVK